MHGLEEIVRRNGVEEPEGDFSPDMRREFNRRLDKAIVTGEPTFVFNGKEYAVWGQRWGVHAASRLP